ncbi:hypothetical protein ABPG72_008368 [Tetrahymena utriculariae]
MAKHLILITLAIVGTLASQKLDFPYSIYNSEIPFEVRQQMKNITNTQNCTANSPIHKFKYNTTKVNDIKFADFCTDYSQRTCCTNDNLNWLRIQFYRQVYNNQDLSLDCQQVLQRLICYDCDGDVGLGFRKGLCGPQCESIYEQCKNDYFIIDQNTQLLKVCSRQDILCSKLHQIVSQKTDFCKLLGHEINDYQDYDEWFYQFYSDKFDQFQINFKPVCWNFMPSSYIFGPALPPLNEQVKTKKNENPFKNPFDKFTQSYSIIMLILYIFLAIIIIVSVVFCAYLYMSYRSTQQGRRIGGQKKNHHD